MVISITQALSLDNLIKMTYFILSFEIFYGLFYSLLEHSKISDKESLIVFQIEKERLMTTNNHLCHIAFTLFL